MPEENGFRSIIVEAPHGGRFEADIPCGTPLSKLAADFFESQGWPTQDQRGRGQRAVVELVNPKNSDETKRLDGEDDICESGVEDGDTLRVFPESIAGAVDQKARINALVMDHNDMNALVDRNPKVTFTANRFHAPDRYDVTFHYPSFIALISGESKPRIGETHQATITLGAEYPRRAPFVIWQTPIFHPNIDPSDGEVCLGVLKDRYLPGLGLARLINMLAEMVQWRNFDAFNAFNKTASEWSVDSHNWKHIREIGGHPFQGPIGELVKKLNRDDRPSIQFRPVLSAH